VATGKKKKTHRFYALVSTKKPVSPSPVNLALPSFFVVDFLSACGELRHTLVVFVAFRGFQQASRKI
jgi:hypothetical protein